MKKVGILVGHFGSGTGAGTPDRDEFTLACMDALRLSAYLQKDGLLCPVVIGVNKNEHPWDLVQRVSRISLPSFLGGWGNIDLRAAWAIRDEVDAAVEFHINSADPSVKGHEVFIRRFPGPKTRRLGQCLINEFEVLDNRNRGLKQKSFRVLRKLHAANIPAAILEPAFIAETCWGSREWRDKYVSAIRIALYRFFNL